MEPVRPAALVLDRGRRWSLTVVNVGLACCAVEAMVASLSTTSPVGTVPYAGDRSVDVLVISGTVTDALAPLVRQLHDALPGPVKVLSFGACANSGGPYWDSYSVTKGVDRVLPVDAWVPGCPPPPEALLDALEALAPAGQGARVLDAPLVRPSSGPVGPQDLRGRRL
ncbi:MAG: NADH-quinone oxidoreductase subunit NuoB [Actinomycetota bacterium]|nr:NADH-quinone oxidoreductase subunit NuoB [Actinomycetota bacterium]